jgi:hypothetical protein
MANISGLTALDPRVIATEKFIESKKIPPDQVPQFLMKMGADPRLVGLVSKYQQLQQAAAQQPKGPMPTTTVAQDVNAQAMAMAPQRQQGVAGLPAPVMDRAQFAGGGIIGFISGGPTSDEDPFRPDPEVQRQIRDQAGFVGEATDDFRRGYANLGIDRYSGINGWDPATQEMQRKWDASSVPEAIRNGLVAPPPDLPTHGHDVRLYPPEGGWQGMAGGGIVAFAGPDGSDVTDLTKLSDAELEALSKQAKDRNTAIAVWNEFSRRRGFDKSPADYAREGLSGIRQSLGMGRYAPGAPRPQAPAEAARPASVPSTFAGSQFDPVTRAQAGLTSVMTGADRPQPPAGVRMPSSAAPTSSVDSMYDKAIKEAQERKMYERAKDTTTPEEVAELKEKLKKLPEDKKRDAYLALAQAGFTMAQAASQRGATALGALGAGGTEGIKQLASLNKEYKQLDRDLNKEMRSLQRYQTQVENQDRERNFNFEQSKADRIESLRFAKAQNQEQRSQFAESIGLKREGLDIERRAVDTKRDPRAEIERAYWEAIQSGDNVRAKQALDALKQMGEASSSYLSTQLREANRNPFAMGIPGAGGIGGGGQFTVLGSRPAE